MSLNVANIRQQFAVYGRDWGQHPLTYLDSAASAQKPEAVLQAEQDFYQHHYANIHRGVYKLSAEATLAYDAARTRVARFIGVDAGEIVFTRNATESVNLVAQSWGRTFLKPGDAVLLTMLEHHANIVPWQLLRDQLGIRIDVVDIADDGSIDVNDVAAKITPQTKLVAVTHMSNALGVVPPVAEMIKLAHSHGAKVLVDGSQAVVHGGVDVRALDADFYVFTGHKLYGPTGIGVLFGKKELLAAMPPYQGGGDMIRTVTFEKTTYADAPARFEAGTPNIAGAVALATALDWMAGLGFDTIKTHETNLLREATRQLKQISGVRVLGDVTNKGPVISFVMDGIHPHDIGTILDQHNICVRTGQHCAEPLMRRLGVPATTRASFGVYNDTDDVTRLVAGIHAVKELFGR